MRMMILQAQLPQVAIEQILDALSRMGPDQPLALSSVVKQHQRRDAAYPMLRRGARVFVHVYFQKKDLTAAPSRKLIQQRRDRAARPAPGRPEVDEQRQPGLTDERGQRPVIHGNGAEQELLMTCAAARWLGET
jgi:hypothetical protein